MPSPPLAPRHWFSHWVAGSSISFLMRARCAGSLSRSISLSLPPFRTHVVKHASSPLEPRVYGYTLAPPSHPRPGAPPLPFTPPPLSPPLPPHPLFRAHMPPQLPA